MNTTTDRTDKLAELAAHLRNGDWNLRAPQELADLIADKIEGIAALHRETEPVAWGWRWCSGVVVDLNYDTREAAEHAWEAMNRNDGQVVSVYLTAPLQASSNAVLLNGLTKAETEATASVSGLQASSVVPAEPVARPEFAEAFRAAWKRQVGGAMNTAGCEVALRVAGSVLPDSSAPDMRAICERLGFDPTNHHNAAKCPYCRPADSEERKPLSEHCQCKACRDGVIHASDCAVHNEPAEANGLCDCGVSDPVDYELASCLETVFSELEQGGHTWALGSCYEEGKRLLKERLYLNIGPKE